MPGHSAQELDGPLTPAMDGEGDDDRDEPIYRASFLALCTAARIKKRTVTAK